MLEFCVKTKAFFCSLPALPPAAATPLLRWTRAPYFRTAVPQRRSVGRSSGDTVQSQWWAGNGTKREERRWHDEASRHGDRAKVSGVPLVGRIEASSIRERGL